MGIKVKTEGATEEDVEVTEEDVEVTEEDVEEAALGMLHKNHWFQQRDPALSLWYPITLNSEW